MFGKRLNIGKLSNLPIITLYFFSSHLCVFFLSINQRHITIHSLFGSQYGGGGGLPSITKQLEQQKHLPNRRLNQALTRPDMPRRPGLTLELRKYMQKLPQTTHADPKVAKVSGTTIHKQATSQEEVDALKTEG